MRVEGDDQELDTDRNREHAGKQPKNDTDRADHLQEADYIAKGKRRLDAAPGQALAANPAIVDDVSLVRPWASSMPPAVTRTRRYDRSADLA
jgi:hypothetical protein